MFYGDFKDFFIRAASDKVLCDKHLILLKIQNLVDFNVNLVQWFINVLIKKFSGGAVIQGDKSTIKCKIMTNQRLQT